MTKRDRRRSERRVCGHENRERRHARRESESIVETCNGSKRAGSIVGEAETEAGI